MIVPAMEVRKILGMPPEEKTAEIDNDSSFYTTLYPNQVYQKTVKMIFGKSVSQDMFLK
jgi:hypothetical protein